MGIVAVPAAPQLVDDGPLAILPAAEVDENLFLLRALEETYNTWPKSDSPQLTEWISFTRHRTSKLRAAIRAKGLDSRIGQSYDDCLAFLSTYETFVANLGLIQRQTQGQVWGDAWASLLTGVHDKLKTESAAKSFGTSKDDAEGVGNVIGLISGLSAAYTRSEKRTAEQRAAVQAEQRHLDAAWIDTEANTEAVAKRLTATYQWGLGEAGFDGFESKQLGDFVRRRPRDPFALIRYAATRVDNETVLDVTGDAERCVRAAQLVPAGSEYDTFRDQFLAEAAELGVRAGSMDLRGGAYKYAPSPSTPLALSLTRTYLAVSLGDPSGHAHMLLARALGEAGRFREAIEAANVARKDWESDPGFCYRYTRLMSIVNEVDLAGNWLSQAYRVGYKDVAFVRADPDLGNFRDGRPQRYKQLTDVQLTYKVDFGIFNDDIVLTNNSLFALTDVRLNVWIRKGDRTWQPKVECDLIQPGQTCKAENVVSIPGSAYDEIRGTLYCDQQAQ